MSGDWKPGDVAVAVLGDGSEVVVIRTKDSCHLCASQSASHWHGLAGNLPGNYPDVRPLVVIDPEDREQVERLINAWYEQQRGPVKVAHERMQAALRSLIEPPRPDEPTSMWSVVVDSEDDHWVRVLGPDFADGWVRAGALPSNGVWTCYADIKAVRVLSEGVTA